MKVLAINGSPRTGGNTAILIEYVFGELHNEGISTELYQLGGNKIHGCTDCRKCFKNRDQHCVIKDDVVNECIAKMIEADGIILASPTYYTDVTTEMKALIDRAGFVVSANGHILKRKVGAAVVAVRRMGGIHAFDTLNHFFLYCQMIIPASSYWNVGIGLAPGDVNSDKEGIEIMKTLGQNMAWVLKRTVDIDGGSLQDA